jgi:hypothetical protein
VKPGSHHVAEEIVLQALIEKGATNLQAKVGAKVASFGEHCWISDTQMRTLIKRGDGRAYHRESIGRARRLLARAGCIESKRVFPQQTPIGAKYRSTHGTTSKRILWKTLGLKSPMTRGDRKERARQQNHVTNLPSLEQSAPRARVALHPDLVAMVMGVPKGPRPEPRNPSERPIHRERREERTTQDKAAEQRRALEQWSRDNERGPPSRF